MKVEGGRIAEVGVRRSGVVAVKVWVPGHPVPQPRPRFNSTTRRTWTPAAAVDHKALVRQTIDLDRSSWRKKSVADDFAVRLDFYTTSWQADVDNLAKLVLDAMNDLVYDDDRRVSLLVVEKTVVPAPDEGTGVLVIRNEPRRK